MIYEIQSKNDIISGATLLLKIPEEDLDKKALYTIQEDRPDFILPFQHRIIDGQAEFSYHIGTQSKLAYIAGERLPKDYTDLWSSVLSPLFDCADWFLKPYSFVLDIKHLYCDKNKNTVSYVYIPSIRDCCDYYNLKEMVVNFSGQITVRDAEMENRVLRAIMMDFNPKAFIKMLKDYTAPNAPQVYLPESRVNYLCEQAEETQITQQLPRIAQNSSISESNEMHEQDKPASFFEDIIINLPLQSKGASFEKKKKKDKMEAKKDKEAKSKNREGALGVFRKKADYAQNSPVKTDTAPSVIMNLPSQQTAEASKLSASYERVKEYKEYKEYEDVTESLSYEINGVWLMLIGNASLPSSIEVAIGTGEVFTIGRYDSAIGKAQSNFEFDRMTKAISRRHAAIEREADVYSLIDLSSSAGTYIDGHRLPPNTPCILEAGSRVSFGNCGADYTWVQ